jgi:hypothetical protein
MPASHIHAEGRTAHVSGSPRVTLPAWGRRRFLSVLSRGADSSEK